MAGKGGLAEDFRTRLKSDAEEVELKLVNVVKKEVTDPLDELFFRKPVHQHVREFGQLFGLIGLIALCVVLWKGRTGLPIYGWSFFTVFFLVMGYRFPRQLHPIWKLWMAFAEKLSVITSAITLSIAWAIIVSPLALILRVVGKRMMDTSFRKTCSTYWEERSAKENDFKLLRRQY